MEVVDVVLQYCNHLERAMFAVTSLRKQDVILGLTWLREYDPEVEGRQGQDELLSQPLSNMSE